MTSSVEPHHGVGGELDLPEHIGPASTTSIISAIVSGIIAYFVGSRKQKITDARRREEADTKLRTGMVDADVNLYKETLETQAERIKALEDRMGPLIEKASNSEWQEREIRRLTTENEKRIAEHEACKLTVADQAREIALLRSRVEVMSVSLRDTGLNE